MPDFVAVLGRLDALRDHDLAPLQRSADQWRTARLAPGMLLWKQGRAVDCCGFILDGELEVVVDGVAVARLRAGEWIGELWPAPGTLHPWTLRAATAVDVALLPGTAQQRLYAHDIAGTLALARVALARLATRTFAAYAVLMTYRVGRLPRPLRPVDRWARWMSGPGVRPRAAPLLARIAPLRAAGEAAITAIATKLSPLRVAAGDIVTLSGDVDPRALLVADGSVHVLFNHHTGLAAELVAQVGPPGLIGCEALAGMTTRQTAIVAASSGWLFALSVDSYESLPAAVRLAWLSAALSSATGACRDATRALCAAKQARAREEPEILIDTEDAPSASMIALIEAQQDASSSMSARLESGPDRTG